MRQLHPKPAGGADRWAVARLPAVDKSEKLFPHYADKRPAHKKKMSFGEMSLVRSKLSDLLPSAN